MRLLSRNLPLLAVGALYALLAGSASALPTTYYMIAGSQMSMVNSVCPVSAPCTVPVTGSVTLDDDGLGNVLLTDVSLAHVGYEVASPGLVSVVIDRDSITLGAGSVAGTGSTLTSVLYGSTTLAQVGTVTCTNGLFQCLGATGLPAGSSPLPTSVAVTLGPWIFNPTGSNLTAAFTYTSVVTPQPATETLTLVAEIPEPGTVLLMAAGLVGMALRRRAGR